MMLCYIKRTPSAGCRNGFVNSLSEGSIPSSDFVRLSTTDSRVLDAEGQFAIMVAGLTNPLSLEVEPSYEKSPPARAAISLSA